MTKKYDIVTRFGFTASMAMAVAVAGGLIIGEAIGGANPQHESSHQPLLITADLRRLSHACLPSLRD